MVRKLRRRVRRRSRQRGRIIDHGSRRKPDEDLVVNRGGSWGCRTADWEPYRTRHALRPRPDEARNLVVLGQLKEWVRETAESNACVWWLWVYCRRLREVVRIAGPSVYKALLCARGEVAFPTRARRPPPRRYVARCRHRREGGVPRPGATVQSRSKFSQSLVQNVLIQKPPRPLSTLGRASPSPFRMSTGAARRPARRLAAAVCHSADRGKQLQARMRRGAEERAVR